jgi:hypothetical protein
MQQLDIFADSVPVQRANALIAALSRFDRVASQQALELLVAADSQCEGLPRFRVLCEFVDHWPDSCDEPDWPRIQTDIAVAEQLIRERVMPAATIMGDAGVALVQRSWSVLAKASEAARIGPEHCDCFAAELYLRAQQFPDVVRTAQGLPGAEMRAAVQRWLGLGYCGCGEAEQAGRAVLRYAWLAPQRFHVFVEEMRDAMLARDWRSFQADLGDLDATWFPAWCVQEKKADSTLLDNLPTADGATAYRLVVGLAIRERGGLCPAVYEDRARLKRLNESFFAFYMKCRSNPRPQQR